MTTPCSLCAWDRTRNWVGDARAWRAYTFVGYVSQRHDYGLGVISEHPMPTSFCRRHQSQRRSEEHTSELQSLMRISYAVFCLKKKKNNTTSSPQYTNTNN